MDSIVEHQTVALTDLAGILAQADDLEGLVRPLLELVTQVTDYEVAYFSIHDRFNDRQVWRFVHTSAGVGPPEGETWPWNEVLCHWVESRNRNSIIDLASEIPGHPSDRYLGVRGFLSIPYRLVGRGGEIGGTLCATSSHPVEPEPEVVQIVELFASSRPWSIASAGRSTTVENASAPMRRSANWSSGRGSSPPPSTP